ncbi:MAG: sensor histidine kinase [Flavobacteriales bacterium]|nr:MAG: sensor histidine kinase [Flavobacteriales bacterium]
MTNTPVFSERTEIERLNEFASVVTHNLKTPIAAVKMMASLLEDVSSLEEAREIGAELIDAVENLQEYYGEMEKVYRSIRQPEDPPVEVSIRQILNEVTHRMLPIIENVKAEISVDFDGGEWIWFRELSLNSVLQNLLSNAIKYRREEAVPKIHIRTIDRGDMLELQISDNGEGIDLKKYGDKVFKLFETFSANKDASGIGLFVVKNQIESMGGKISLISELGVGTTFYLEFVKASNSTNRI